MTGPLIPDALFTVFAAVLGLLIGSFSNVLIWRLPRRESINFPPSHCPTCDHSLAALDLVPVLSWAALGGKCRSCKSPISVRYPIVELITGAAYALLSVVFPFSQVGPGLIGLCLLFTLLLVASVIDQETYTIPDEISLPGAALGLLFGLLQALSIQLDGEGLIPSSLLQVLPYLVTILALIFTGKSAAPRAAGKPYDG